MYYFLVAFGVMLHVFFWGMGAAMLLVPRPWKRAWPLLAGACGFALQSLVVWLGAYANLRGTDSYALGSEAIPAMLLFFACWRRGCFTALLDLKRVWPVGLAVGLILAALVAPMAIGAKGVGLTSMSLGSCDAADYAAGARVLKEFAHSDRGGFLGLTEVVRVMSTDNFFDFWLRLNHFTPSALIALNGSVVDCAPHELTSIMTAVLLALSVPAVFWLARAVMHYRPTVSWWIALLYGLSPITWYAVFQVAMGQLLAAQAIILLTWAGVALWRSGLTWRRGWALSGVLFVGYTLVLGSYNFILLVALIPAVAYAGAFAFWRGEWRRFARWALVMLVPLAVCSLVFFERVAGLAERFALFQAFDFGWRIPVLSPEGWLGMLASDQLTAFPSSIRIILVLLVVGMLGLALLRGAKQRRKEAFVAVALSVPALIGYGYLNLRGAQLGTNASYDAYKLFSVFYPGLLVALCYWTTLSSIRRGVGRWAVFGLAGLITVLTANVAYRFASRMENPPLIVGRDLLAVKKIERMTDVASLNMRIPDMWSRLWANSLLLRKPQYFSTHTYEARLNTPLRGEWDLNGDLLELRLPASGSRRLNGNFSLADTRDPYFLRAQLGQGWNDMERPARSSQQWRWTKEVATFSIENPQDHPLRVSCRFTELHSLVPRDFQVWMGSTHLQTVQVTEAHSAVQLPALVVPPGVTHFEIRTTVPLTHPAGGDNRLLGFRIFGIELQVLPAESE